jgi:hypothetical protein
MAEILIMRAHPFDSTAVLDVFQGPEVPSGLLPDGSNDSVTLYGDTTDVYAAWGLGFNTAPTDDPASIHIPGALALPFAYDIQLFGDADLVQPGAIAGSGRLELLDPAGDLDAWLGYAWDGRDIDILRGDSAAALADFAVVARVTCDGWADGGVSHKSKALKLRDFGWRLAVPFPVSRYAGTGGLEGTADLAGKTKPFVLRRAFSVAPVPVIPDELVFQYHSPEFGFVGNPPLVSVGGVDWDTAGDFATYPELRDASIPAGQFASCAALGLIRLGSAIPEGLELRIKSAFGFSTGFGQGLIEDLIHEVARTLPGLQSMTADVHFESADDPDLGWFIPSTNGAPPSIADLLNTILYNAGCYWWVSLDGETVYVREIVDPSTQSADIELDCSRRYVLASEPKISISIPRQSINFLRNRKWPAQARATLAGSVSEETAFLLTSEYLPSVASDGLTTGVKHRLARVFTAATALQGTSTIDRARHFLEIFKTQRYIFTARFGEMDPLAPPIGQIIELQNLNRFGFGASKKMLCIGAKASAERNRLELTLWG